MPAAVDDRAWLRAMLDFEVALAQASAEVGLVAQDAAQEIASVCTEAELDLAELGRGTARHGTPIPALIAALSTRLSPEAGAHLHRGATSQDVIDTAAMLVAHRALGPLLDDLGAAAETCAALAEEHRHTLQAGRTLLQQALPITFGLTAAGWLVALDEAATQLTQLREHTLAVQLGGVAGTLASLGDSGVEIACGVALRLGLAEPTLPWHSNRLRIALLAGALGATAGAAGKIATDVALLAQSEVGELAEGGGGGGSSTLPHERNPVAAVAARACAERVPGLVATLLGAMAGEHQRAAGAWQAESETLSDLLRLSGSAVAAVRSLLEGLEVLPQWMRANIELSGGLLMSESLTTALTGSLGRASAHALIERAARRAIESEQSLREVAYDVPEIVAALGAEGIDAALDPAACLGSTDALIDRALIAHHTRLGDG